MARTKTAKTDVAAKTTKTKATGTKAAATKLFDDSAEEQHRHIPRDAEGLPIFLILSAEARAWFDAWLADFEHSWRETRDPGAVGEAQAWCHIFRQPAPKWLEEAVWSVVLARRSKVHIKRARDAAMRWWRFFLVRQNKREGHSWAHAYERTAAHLAGAGDAIDSDTVRRSYMQVVKDLREGRRGRYRTTPCHIRLRTPDSV